MTASWGDTRREALLSKRRLSAVNSSRLLSAYAEIMAKILVVTYSFTGTGNRLTELLCRSRNWESASVVERRPRKAWVTLRCALDSFFRRQPPSSTTGRTLPGLTSSCWWRRSG